MKSEKFKEFKEELNLIDKWDMLFEVERILLTDGRGIYPDPNHLRFYFLDNEILIKHGKGRAYGARLSTNFVISSARNSILINGPIISTSKYYDDFRIPKKGDILVVLDRNGNIKSENSIESTVNAINGFRISLLGTLNITNDMLLCFYDPTEFNVDVCSHNQVAPGIFIKFEENSYGKIHKKFGRYHETLRIKDIQEIELKLITEKKITFK